MNCDYCSTPITPADADRRIQGGNFHHFCATRMIVGSVGHLMHSCSCYGGQDGDPPGLSHREAALAAYYYHLGQGMRINLDAQHADCD